MKKMIINLQASLFGALPERLKYPLNQVRIILRYVNWYLNKRGRKRSTTILAQYKNKFAGYRCVVIGNGPSLNNMNLSLLKNEFTFGLNRIYLLFEKMGFSTSFFVSINRLVIEQFGEEISRVNSLKVLNWSCENYVTKDENTVFLSARPTTTKMDGEIINGYFHTGGSVTNVALELAYYMGFSEVILIGVDHSFVEQGTGGKAIVSKGADQNHFSENYFGAGVVWQLPNYSTMEYGYVQAKKLFEGDKRIIVDATVGGNLQVFEKVDFEIYLKNSKSKSKKGRENSL